MISGSPKTSSSATATTVTATQTTSLNRTVLRTPSISFLPKYCAVKIPAPLTAPKMVMLKIKMSWLTIETPAICSVPMLPTMMLSTMLTKLVIKFWSKIGMVMAKTIL